jgi:hypothetical protein
LNRLKEQTLTNNNWFIEKLPARDIEHALEIISNSMLIKEQKAVSQSCNFIYKAIKIKLEEYEIISTSMRNESHHGSLLVEQPK